MTDQQILATEIDAHLRTLRNANTQATAVEWMKAAYNLLARASDDMKKPRVFSIPGHFGERTFMVEMPKPLELPTCQPVKPLGFFDHRVKTVVYGDKYSNTRAWTRADTRRLERQAAQKVKA